MDSDRVGGVFALPDIPTRPRLNFCVREGPTGQGTVTNTSVAAVLDVETTGRDPSKHHIIELAIRRFRFDGDGVITDIGKCYSWLEDPGYPLDAEIRRITGLVDSDLVGQAIVDRAATNVLMSADVIIAHNASFDRRFVEQRLIDAIGLPWACSCYEIDWLSRGLNVRSLGCLLCKQGWNHDGHRAAVDVDAVVNLLEHRDENGRTALAELFDTAREPGWRVRARGAHIDVKEQLKARGYRWDLDARVWFKDLKDKDRFAEEMWLESNVYIASAKPRALQPDIDAIDWTQRWA